MPFMDNLFLVMDDFTSILEFENYIHVQTAYTAQWSVSNGLIDCSLSLIFFGDADRNKLKVEESIFALLFMVHCHQRLGPDRWSFCL